MFSINKWLIDLFTTIFWLKGLLKPYMRHLRLSVYIGLMILMKRNFNIITVSYNSYNFLGTGNGSNKPFLFHQDGVKLRFSANNRTNYLE